MSFSIFFFILLLVVPTHEASELATQTCDKTSVKELCNSVLGTSTATDADGLVKEALAATTREGGDVSVQIAKLLTSGGATAQKGLTECGDIYKTAMDKLKAATKALNEKSYADVETKVTDSKDTAKSCEDGFSGASPITEQNTKFSNLCDLTLAIVKTIKG
ncbi:uncharacterized protein LOC110611534 [Manihot esculenta]|uniref:Uncharacterized protein n=1 Tax=Manihot esculenta TaxID=3983 RepID=A0ACB7HXT8_MANES|nr:uncharacterized protein LOC110611534 [Manihot esculenta]KAG8657602.1 hypothetical protein MANES_03G083162v8 [Manihot esculenta]